MKRQEGVLIVIVLIIILFAWLLTYLIPFLAIVALLAVVLFLIISVYLICELIYFKSKKFQKIKNGIQEHVKECNKLNTHINHLKQAYINIRSSDYGAATYTDQSVYHFKRPELAKIQKNHYTYECSLTVCKNAQQQPFKYICKYFNVSATEETLTKFEMVFNDFAAAEQGKVLLKAKEDLLINNLGKQIPFFIRTFRKATLSKKLGFDHVDLSNLHFPKYTFLYVSAGGNSSMRCDVVFDLNNLERFIKYLSDVIKSKKSVAGQRALVTLALREKIKRRDHFTCQKCGISVRDEPHLLLEIDHIIPLSKDGKTVEENLQTLCWKCNRTKGARME